MDSSNVELTVDGEAVGTAVLPLPIPPRAIDEEGGEAVGVAVSPIPGVPEAGEREDAGADEKVSPRLAAVGAAVGEPVARTELGKSPLVLETPAPGAGALVGAADGADVGANVAKSRPPRPLVPEEELVVGKSTRNPVGATVGAVLAASVLGAGEPEDVALPSSSCPGLLPSAGLGIGTPTETGGPVGAVALGACSPPPYAPGAVGPGLGSSPPRPPPDPGGGVRPDGLGVDRLSRASSSGPA